MKPQRGGKAYHKLKGLHPTQRCTPHSVAPQAARSRRTQAARSRRTGEVREPREPRRQHGRTTPATKTKHLVPMPRLKGPIFLLSCVELLLGFHVKLIGSPLQQATRPRLRRRGQGRRIRCKEPRLTAQSARGDGLKGQRLVPPLRHRAQARVLRAGVETSGRESPKH